jgi:hypothetical protein
MKYFSVRGTIFALVIAVVYSYSVHIEPATIECFIVTASPGVPITGSFEVISPDPKFITVTARGPNGYLHFEKKPTVDLEKEDKEDASEGFFSFDAEEEGDYTMCISNGNEEQSDGVTRLVAFNFRAVRVGEQDYQFVGLQSELADLKEGLALMRDHQSYINQREDVHKAAIDNINIKVLCWTILEAIILIAMALWQISYIRGFFEIKRRM